MKIREKRVEELIPYENNPRDNDRAVNGVAASIREFGFKVPIVIDHNNVVITGHTRLKAAKQLGLKTVPVIVADDLTENQVRAFRLADNKVADAARWIPDLVEIELNNIDELDMEEFGFDVDDFYDGGYEGDAVERTNDAYNLYAYDECRTEGFWQIPKLKPCDFIPSDLIRFDYVLTTDRRDGGVHFFMDDYKFERIWNQPNKYIPRLKEFECVLTPDFSLYLDMPRAMKLWNIYRSMLIGQKLQDAGIKVIPTLMWAEEETFDFCFDGLPVGGTVATSTVGVMRSKDSIALWKKGMDEALKRSRPKNIVCYGAEIDFDSGGANVVWMDTRESYRGKSR